jgi:hypothetical protein
MSVDKRTALLQHIEACRARLAEMTNPHERDAIHYLIEQLEAELDAMPPETTPDAQ